MELIITASSIECIEVATSHRPLSTPSRHSEAAWLTTGSGSGAAAMATTGGTWDIVAILTTAAERQLVAQSDILGVKNERPGVGRKQPLGLSVVTITMQLSAMPRFIKTAPRHCWSVCRFHAAASSGWVKET